MKISTTNFNYPSFKMHRINGYYPIGKGQYLDEYRDGVVNSNETYFFRTDINWPVFCDYINKRFYDCQSVDTIIYGCSNGSEPYSLSMLLQSATNNSNKFFPIKAFDIDEGLIVENNKNKNSFKIPNSDFSRIEDLFYSINQDCAPYIFQDNYCNYYLTNKTTKPVEFKQGNLIEDIEKIKFEKPAIFMARNMWPYVSPGEYGTFARKLFTKLPNGSSVIIGDFDYKGNRYLGTNDFPNILMETGFIQSAYNISRDIPRKNLAFEKD